EGRREHRLRLLDLQRRCARAGPQPRPLPPRRSAGRAGDAPALGIRLARQPPDPLQPLLRRSGWRALVGAEALRLWDVEQKRWAGADIPDFPKERPPDYRPDWSQRPTGMDAHPGTAT